MRKKIADTALKAGNTYACDCDVWGTPHSHFHNYNTGSIEKIVTDPDTGGMKGTKPYEYHAFPAESLRELAQVYAFGRAKYDDYNFRKGYRWSLSYDALQRHLWAFWSREDRDPESGLHHLAHAAWHCLTLLLFSIAGKGQDDRPT